MITVKILTFNLFSVNTYILSDETKECVIIDPGCSNSSEEKELEDYIIEQSLKPVSQIITHYHIDHILGVGFVKHRWGLSAIAHAEGNLFWQNKKMGYEFGLPANKVVEPEIFTEEGEKLKFGNSVLEVVYVPGHADGSICLVNHEQKFVIAGDVLFYGSIGRTDLPTGDYDILKKGITEKLYTLNDDYTVYPGHGPKTEIGIERKHNPYL